MLTAIIDGEAVDDELLQIPGKLVERDSVRPIEASDVQQEEAH